MGISRIVFLGFLLSVSHIFHRYLRSGNKWDHRKPYPAKWQFIYSACEAEALQGLTCFTFVSHLFIQPQENINSWYSLDSQQLPSPENQQDYTSRPFQMLFWIHNAIRAVLMHVLARNSLTLNSCTQWKQFIIEGFEPSLSSYRRANITRGAWINRDGAVLKILMLL